MNKEQRWIGFHRIDTMNEHKRQAVILWLKGQKLTDYGYDRKEFTRYISLKKRLLKQVKVFPSKCYWEKLKSLDRLEYNESLPMRKAVRYMVGQSFNEELLNILMLLVRGKSFWQYESEREKLL